MYWDTASKVIIMIILYLVAMFAGVQIGKKVERPAKQQLLPPHMEEQDPEKAKEREI
jgi:hypothetical protein